VVILSKSVGLCGELNHAAYFTIIKQGPGAIKRL